MPGFQNSRLAVLVNTVEPFQFKTKVLDIEPKFGSKPQEDSWETLQVIDK
jgi:hypothetical protein